MVNNLKQASPAMFRLYKIIKERGADSPITDDEIAIASGQMPLDSKKMKEYLDNIERTSENLRAAFQKQAQASKVGLYFHFQFSSLTYICNLGTLRPGDDEPAYYRVDCGL
jgi:hypothetical protein